MIDQDTLDRIPFFRELSDGARRELAIRSVLRDFEPGEILWKEGAKPRGLFIVLDGEVRVVRASDDRRHVIHTERCGGTLGEVPFFEGGRYPATAMATRPTSCLVLTREAVHAAFREDPELAFVFLGSLATRVRELVDRLDRHVRKSVRARMAEFLLDRCEASGSDVVTLGTTQLGVAEELGTVREVVVRALGELRDEGIIASAGRGRYELMDLERLRAAASS
ncbi:MAG: Crp/Fnr family transcriptional regulator [Gemmatimonadota bacterium]